MKFAIENIAWQKISNLLPVIIQDSETLQVLMLGYMNQAALGKTLETGLVTFYSRSKERLWTKGETSGNYLKLIEMTLDCDQDALLITAKPQGDTCHLGQVSCFNPSKAPGLGFLAQLEQIITMREEERPDNSYTTELFNAGTQRIAQKVGEEAVEVALASVASNEQDFQAEVADLLYHLLVLLKSKNLSLSSIVELLRQRHH